MSLRRPNVVVFDVIETMLSLEPVRAALEPLGVSVELFLTRLLRDGFALSLAGTYRPFRDVANATVEALAHDASREQVDRVLAAFQQLRPYSDVEPALERLAAADVSVVTLTNGDQQATTSLGGQRPRPLHRPCPHHSGRATLEAVTNPLPACCRQPRTPAE